MLSAPKTKISLFFWLTLFAFNSARFFDINFGGTPFLVKLSFTISSSTFEGLTTQSILFFF